MRVLLVGNCHAQYLGAALSTLPGAEVRVVGEPYVGPVHFAGVLPGMVTRAEGRDWLPDGGLFLRQVTDNQRWGEIALPSAPAETIRFPYFETRSRFGLEERFDLDAAFRAAGLDPSGVRRALEAPGAVMGYNKFSGLVFAELLEALRPRLEPHLGDVSDLVQRVRTDRGLAHDPEPALLEAPSSPELAEQVRWRKSLRRYLRTGSRVEFIACLRLYRPRLYASWTIAIAEALVERGRVYWATRLICWRIGLEDARGRLFAHALGMAWRIRENYDAFRALERAALEMPDTNLPLLLSCVRRLG
jgi:hypothetical protein